MPGKQQNGKRGKEHQRDAGGGSPCGPAARKRQRQRKRRGVQKGLRIKHELETERRETAQGSSACSERLCSV